jgi:hypothetical protein
MSGNPARAILARQQGDDYQALWFWIQAMRLLVENSIVERVGLEKREFYGFDDVITYYKDGARRPRSRVDAHQLKFHILGNGALSIETITDPAFIGSPNISLLHRLIAAHTALGDEVDLVLVSPWDVHPDGLLAEMWEKGRDGIFRLEPLFRGSRRSAAGKQRARLASHARVDEATLKRALARLRVNRSFGLPALRDQLNDKLHICGFAAVGEDQLHSPYTDLGRRLMEDAERVFTAAQIREILTRENLVAKQAVKGVPVGIRSFQRLAGYLDEFTHLLDLLPHFADRELRAGVNWSDIRERVMTFMHGIDEAGHAVAELHLACHTSIAYAAGHAVAKSATHYHARQPGQRGDDVWDFGEREPGNADQFWRHSSEALRADAPAVAVAVSVANATAGDVKQYVLKHLASVGTLVHLEPTAGASKTSVRSGAHAAALAETYAQVVNDARTGDQRRAMLHVLISGPVTLSFLMGRAGVRLGPTTIYEFAFERNDPEAYSPAIALAAKPQGIRYASDTEF